MLFFKLNFIVKWKYFIFINSQGYLQRRMTRQLYQSGDTSKTVCHALLLSIFCRSEKSTSNISLVGIVCCWYFAGRKKVPLVILLVGCVYKLWTLREIPSCIFSVVQKAVIWCKHFVLSRIVSKETWSTWFSYFTSLLIAV